MILVLIIHPGSSDIKPDFGQGDAGQDINTEDAILDLIRSAFMVSFLILY